MRIDGKSLQRDEVLQVNEVINKHWDSVESLSVSLREDFVQSSFGPDAVEMLVGGDEWIVCDRIEPNAVFFYEEKTTWVACRELFNIASKFSTLERITWHLVKESQ